MSTYSFVRPLYRSIADTETILFDWIIPMDHHLTSVLNYFRDWLSFEL
jgi:hypothetical protein